MMMLIWPAFVIEVLQGGVRQDCETMSAQKIAPIPNVKMTEETPEVCSDKRRRKRRKSRHDICQIFYTSTVSQNLKFSREKARKLRHFSLLIWKFGNFIHII